MQKTFIHFSFFLRFCSIFITNFRLFFPFQLIQKHFKPVGLIKKTTLLTPIFLVACSTAPPKNPENICAIFKENPSWHDSAEDSFDKWGVPPQVLFSILYQESSFKHDALPPKDYLLGFIPWGRVSSAKGYSQAKDETWSDYKKAAGSTFANRGNMDDSLDFMGWYLNNAHKINGTSKWDAYNLYLNYHEGWTGFARKTYLKKKWLMKVSQKVKQRASDYGAQYRSCKADL